ncbi:MAG: nucleotide exchange factor GrpE [Pegethrix bostrychoides GSE-TBD4-15B]|jgi:molecular chaperone GrpE|uniref:Protein GrpE n=1 Tax=Pegethrix bostrychoides GSE-TBD4-15B TaxID=2839662 RepID=A0A951PE20_9CYAN|nr:nucleotide exchange factor GrpE [Pegethrix bostrychoides GSE-TBD4-15B]
MSVENLPDPETSTPETSIPEASANHAADSAAEPNAEFAFDPEAEPFTLDPEPDAQVLDAQVTDAPDIPLSQPDLGSSQVISALTQDIEDLKVQLEDRTSQYMRIAADFENFRKRTQKEKEELEEKVKCSTIKELLSVVDNFERARSQIKPQDDGEMNIHKSYQSVYKQLVDSLKRIGVSPMRSEGKEFDPNLHEAVMREPTADQPEGTVLEELVRGYVLGERVLRHAMVKVAAPPEAAED